MAQSNSVINIDGQLVEHDTIKYDVFRPSGFYQSVYN